MNNKFNFAIQKISAIFIISFIPFSLNLFRTIDFKTEYDVFNSQKENLNMVNDKSGVDIVSIDLDNNYCDTKCFLEGKTDTINFITKAFGIDSNIIIQDLINVNSESEYIIENIGRLTDAENNLMAYSSFERGFIQYLFEYSKKHPENLNRQIKPYSGSSEYIEDLIRYFTNIYEEVDYSVAISIGAAESGYYKVNYMLSCNNVYGGMSNQGLIKYHNIEYGILSYISILSDSYYKKGLNTVESIGKKYCPTYDDKGNKIASPHWINLVRKAEKHYQNTPDVVDINKILEYQN